MDAAALDLLIERAQEARDEAARQHAQRLQRLRQSRGQLDTLADYAADYTRRAGVRLQGGLDVAAAANQRAFLARLELAVAAQRREVAEREADLARSAAAFTEATQGLERLKLLRARQLRAAQEREARRDQKHTDDIAMRARPLLGPEAPAA